MSNAAQTKTSIDLSKRDLTLDLARVFCVLLVVVIHLLFVGVGRDASGGLVISRPLEGQGWFPLATWAGQIMPLFFVVGGFASLTSWRSLKRRGEGGTEFVRNRVLRLAQPALPLFIFYFVVLGAATLIGIDPKLLDAVATGAGSPLWFIAAYALCQAFIPLMVHLHERAPRLTLLGFLAGAILVDVLRYSTGITAIGLANLFFVWLLIQQLGFWYADGWFARRRWWQLVLIAAASYATLVPLTTVFPYSDDMLTNLNPPTVPLIALAVGQACVLRLLRPALAALMRTRGAKAVVFLVGSRLMTIYLWHLPIIIILSGVALLIPGASPAPASAAWWASRPILYVVVLVALFGLSFIVGRWEAPRQLTGTPPAWVVGVAAALTFIPAFLVMQWFLNVWFAGVGALFYAAAVLMLGRWGQGSQPRGVDVPLTREPALSGGVDRGDQAGIERISGA
jgi:peptidoglycan/LPS O-acetylase OafA/YrhL